MALTLGTNCGFVTSAPTTDPSGTTAQISNYYIAINAITPATAARITEIGFWCDTASQEANFEVGLYNNDKTLIQYSQTNAKGTTAGWKKATNLNIAVNEGTNYWIAVQVDTTATITNIDYSSASGKSYIYSSVTTLPTTLGTTQSNLIVAVYAVWDTGAAPSGTNQWINVDDAWRQISEAWVNVDDAWRKISEAWVNVDDVWRKLYST